MCIRDSVNGVRVTVEDGTWGLVRASSNKPELVVVVESPVSEARMRDMFKALDAVLRTHPEDRKLVLALEELAFYSKEMKILGVYPSHAFRTTFDEAAGS